MIASIVSGILVAMAARAARAGGGVHCAGHCGTQVDRADESRSGTGTARDDGRPDAGARRGWRASPQRSPPSCRSCAATTGFLSSPTTAATGPPPSPLEHGAEVVERHDPDRRGKGYALDHGVRHLAAAPPAVVIVVDADCAVAPGSVDLLASECMRRRRPVQALYLMRAPPGAGLKQRMAEFAWAVRNQVRPLGWQRLGGPCQLMGTGMAFPWATLATASLASASIVEDMQLGLDLAASGSPPWYLRRCARHQRLPCAAPRRPSRSARAGSMATSR